MYINGNGISKDLHKAAYLIKLSIENGVVEGETIWEKYELWKYQ